MWEVDMSEPVQTAPDKQGRGLGRGTGVKRNIPPGRTYRGFEIHDHTGTAYSGSIVEVPCLRSGKWLVRAERSRPLTTGSAANIQGYLYYD